MVSGRGMAVNGICMLIYSHVRRILTRITTSTTFRGNDVVIVVAVAVVVPAVSAFGLESTEPGHR